LPDGKLNAAIRRFENEVRRETRIGTGWQLTPNRGEPDPCNGDNVRVLLRLIGAEVRFNLWFQQAEIHWIDGEWTKVTDAELNRLRNIASTEEHLYRPSKEFFRDMLEDNARSHSFDPVLDRIDKIKWDGRPRLLTWLSRTCGVPNDPYHQAIGKNVIGGIVKRARHPGAKHDEVMILISKQGRSKSTLCEILALDKEWFTDSVKFGSRQQDYVPQMFGKLVIELAELDKMSKTEVASVRSFVTAKNDDATLKYKTYSERFPRRCIFIGTCNEENPLVDATGNRRFYPVVVQGEIDLDWLRANVDQLVAEAAVLDSQGETFGIPREVWAIAEQHQEAAREKPEWVLHLEAAITPQTQLGAPQPAEPAPVIITSTDLSTFLASVARRVVRKGEYVPELKKPTLGFTSKEKWIDGKTQSVWIRGNEWYATRLKLHTDAHGRHRLLWPGHSV
jgi:hypothetical protein